MSSFFHRNNGSCIVVNSTSVGNNQSSFYCECEEGFTGIHCELIVNLCVNITCANSGICQSNGLAWKCLCINPSFYGNFCEYQTSSLQVKKALTKSFASVAISVLVLTCSFVVIMDILKYVFRVDPVKTERERLHKHKQAHRAAKAAASKVALRFQYVA